MLSFVFVPLATGAALVIKDDAGSFRFEFTRDEAKTLRAQLDDLIEHPHECATIPELITLASKSYLEF